jgi:hypothetical protein
VSERREPEDQAVFGVLDELALPAGGTSHDDTSPVPPLGDAEEVDVLRRLYHESAGLLAYELTPVAPPLELRMRLLSSLVGDETQEVPQFVPRAADESTRPAFQPPAAPVERRPVAEAAPAVVPAAVEPVRPSESLEPARSRRDSRSAARRPSRWPKALAALFALAAVGLGAWVAMLQSEVDYRDTRIRRLEGELDAKANLATELVAAREALARLEQRYTFVTAPSTTVFALRPPADGALQPLARGHLYVAANRRDWRLEVRGLRPEAAAQDYQLWFIVEGTPRSGGVFDAHTGAVSELAAAQMPGGTTAVAITLEKKGGSPAPTSSILLIADSSVRI